MTSLLLASFIAGTLTVLIPCTLPFLPIILGSSLATNNGIRRNPYLIIGSLLISVTLFTLFIEWITSLVYIPTETWGYVSAVLVLFVGITFLFPSVWGHLPFVKTLSLKANSSIGKRFQQKGMFSDISIGVALAPLFSSCSPTYLLILAVILPASFVMGLIYILAFVAGLGTVLLFVALLGQTLTSKLSVLATKGNLFNRIIGVLMILIALSIFLGFTERFETAILDAGFIDVTQFELSL